MQGGHSMKQHGNGFLPCNEIGEPKAGNERVHLTMDRSLPAGPFDSGSQIEVWQASAHIEAEEGDAGIVARLLRACIDSLACIVHLNDHSSTLKRNRSMLRRCESILKLWADGHGVWSGKLDEVLERSRHLRHTTLCILNPLCKTLLGGLNRSAPRKKDAVVSRLRDDIAQLYSQTKWLIVGAEEMASDTDSDASEDDRTQNMFDGLTVDIKMHIDCLVDLSNALEYPAVDPEQHDNLPSNSRFGQRAAHDYHADLVLAKFPKAGIELAKCLGKTSWDRYQRIQQERDTNSRAIASSSGKEQDGLDSAVKSQVADSSFRDSGLDTSAPTHYAETMISYMTSIVEGTRVQIPPLSTEARSGARFECNACGKHIKARNNREWRKHLYLDLQPYTCFYDSCTFSSIPFADRQLWSNHLEFGHKLGPHWNSIECPLCLEITETGKSQILIHFARHMEDISLAALPREVESEGETDHIVGTDDTSEESFTEDKSISSSISGGNIPCRIRLLDKSQWRDLGIAICKPKLESPYVGTIMAVHQEDASRVLLSVAINEKIKFERGADARIHWTEENGRDVELSFGESSDRDIIWKFIREVKSRQRYTQQEERPGENHAGPKGSWSAADNVSGAVVSPTPELENLGKTRRRRVYRHVMDRLGEWLLANQDNPYPSREVKLALAKECGVTEKTVSTVMSNARARSRRRNDQSLFKDNAIVEQAQEHNPDDKSLPKYFDRHDHLHNFDSAREKVSTNQIYSEEQSLKPGQENGGVAKPSDNKMRKRIRTACLNCQKRQIKCSEERPTCSTCMRLMRQCEGYELPMAVKPAAGASHHERIQDMWEASDISDLDNDTQPQVTKNTDFARRGRRVYRVPSTRAIEAKTAHAVVSDSELSEVDEEILRGGPPKPSQARGSAMTTSTAKIAGSVDTEDHDVAPHDSPLSITQTRPNRSCTECYKRKVRCDRGMPCGACVNRSTTTCTYRPLGVKHGTSQKAPTGSPTAKSDTHQTCASENKGKNVLQSNNMEGIGQVLSQLPSGTPGSKADLQPHYRPSPWKVRDTVYLRLRGGRTAGPFFIAQCHVPLVPKGKWRYDIRDALGNKKLGISEHLVI